jgi:hypothetical protein
MSVRIVASLTCDGQHCKAAVSVKEFRATCAADAMGQAKREAKKRRWLTVSRGRYRTEKHYCPECADGAPLDPFSLDNPNNAPHLDA